MCVCNNIIINDNIINENINWKWNNVILICNDNEINDNE